VASEPLSPLSQSPPRPINHFQGRLPGRYRLCGKKTFIRFSLVHPWESFASRAPRLLDAMSEFTPNPTTPAGIEAQHGGRSQIPVRRRALFHQSDPSRPSDDPFLPSNSKRCRQPRRTSTTCTLCLPLSAHIGARLRPDAHPPYLTGMDTVYLDNPDQSHTCPFAPISEPSHRTASACP
jgi:hypothetical protein